MFFAVARYILKVSYLYIFLFTILNITKNIVLMESKYKFGCKKPVLKVNHTFSKKCLSPKKFLLQEKLQKGKNFQDLNKNLKIAYDNRNECIMAESTCNTNKEKSYQHLTLLLQQQRNLLPIYNCRKQIIQYLKNSDTLVLMSETGSGKTTQIPQFLMEEGFFKQGIIGVTQPRRVAAITVAKRVAEEQNCKLGTRIGYTVRFEDCTSEETCIKFLTDGILLREALTDNLLLKYSVLMLDEAHERTINTDILLGIVKKAQFDRQLKNLVTLKIIITSATMDVDEISRYFGVKGMYLEGRLYPVRVMHVKQPQPDYLHATLVTIFDIHKNYPIGQDILVFLTGQEEIETLAHQIREITKVNSAELFDIKVFPLYANLPQYKQLESFLPSPNARKIVLATNIAETSVTIPGIKFVVDCGYAKRRIYNSINNLDILRVVRISKAQAWQRCGRAGRDGPGVCYRIYTQSEMTSFDDAPTPEILCSNLCTIVLHLLALGIDVYSFDFLDRPRTDAIENAYKKLKDLGAVQTIVNPQLTLLGRRMCKFPLDPRLSKLLLSASSFGCMSEMLSLVAILSGENIFLRNTDRDEFSSLSHLKYQSIYGDHLTLLNVFNAFEKSNNTKVWCNDNFLNLRSLLYIRKVRKQLSEIIERLHIQANSCGENFDRVRKCLLAGFSDNVAKLQRDNFYLTVHGHLRAKIHPSSVFHGKYRPQYLIYSEIVLTENNFLRIVTEINHEWISEIS